MRVIEAPNHAHISSNEVSIFLAGGITGCADWQQEVITLLETHVQKYPLVILNPRRSNFPINEPKAAQAQIEWEFDMLRQADVVLFWFSRETLNPIVLFELGKELGKAYMSEPYYLRTPLVIGADPAYKRRKDIEAQTALVDASLTIYDSIKDVAAQAAREALKLRP